MEPRHRLICSLVLGIVATGIAGCGEATTERDLADSRALGSNTAALEPVILQTDWFAQPEHGGFYQALALGFYEEAGLQVTILQGGPNAQSVQKVLRGRAHFAMNRIDNIMQYASSGMPLRFVMATLQHDPQAVMVHSDSPVLRLADLDGRRVMAVPGLTWIDYLEAKLQISFTVIPHDFGMERFLHDSSLAQQCLQTNEPFFVRKQGVSIRVLPLRESGFDPYHGIYTRADFLEENRDLAERFVRASIRGWQSFIDDDPGPAFDLIRRRNPHMTQDFMEFSREEMRRLRLVGGFEDKGERVGRLDPDRIYDLLNEMKRLALVDPNLAVSAFCDFGLLPVEKEHAASSAE